MNSRFFKNIVQIIGLLLDSTVFVHEYTNNVSLPKHFTTLVYKIIHILKGLINAITFIVTKLILCVCGVGVNEREGTHWSVTNKE